MDCWTSRLMTAAATCVCAAVIVRRWLAPWTWWLGRLALCWARYAMLRSGIDGRSGSGRSDIRPRTSTCPCCDGVDFDGMIGRWAVVTGCTDGIGKEYAIQLANRGMNVALISRNPSKLQDIARMIHERHGGDGVRTRIVVADLSSSGGTVSLSDAYDAVRNALDGLDVALLVNNAALSYTYPERLLDMPPCCPGRESHDPLRDIVECNALGPVAMCRIAMALMMTDRRGSGGGGVIINVASASAYLPSPLLAVYAATKAFVEKFSTDLATEYDDRTNGMPPLIAIRCLTTGFVATKISRLRAGSSEWSFVPRPNVYARRSLRSLGCYCGCRLARRPTDWTDKGDGQGWVESAVSVLFDSPSSPCSPGTYGITTSGYLPHTLMIVGINAVRWVMGDTYMSNAVRRFMSFGAKQMKQRDAEKMREDANAIKRWK